MLTSYGGGEYFLRKDRYSKGAGAAINLSSLYLPWAAAWQWYINSARNSTRKSHAHLSLTPHIRFTKPSSVEKMRFSLVAAFALVVVVSAQRIENLSTCARAWIARAAESSGCDGVQVLLRHLVSN